MSIFGTGRRASCGKKRVTLLLAAALVTLNIPLPLAELAAAPLVTGPVQARPQVITNLTGTVLDAVTDAPLPNVTLTLVGTGKTATTNSLGKFTFFKPPLGPYTLLLDARTTTVPGQWPIFPIPVTLQAGVNTFPTPIWIPELDEENGAVLTAANFNPTTSQVLSTIVVQSPAAPGVKVTIPSGTYLQNVWNPLQLGDVLSVTNVPPTKPPQPLPNNTVPGMLVMTQPGGIQFFSNSTMTTSAKAPMEFPNVQNEFATGAKLSLYAAFGGQFGAPVNGGFMTVQGSTILPDAGTGIPHLACAWTPPNPPVVTTNTGNNPEDLVDPEMASELEIGSEADPLMGRLTIDHPLAAHRAMGMVEQPRLVYTSSTAYPHLVLTSHTSLSSGSPVPLATSASLSVNGIPQGSSVFWQGSSQQTRQAMPFDATGLATGRYDAALNVVNHYQASAVGSVTSKAMLVHNQIASPFGAGWGMSDLQRLQLDAQGNALITDGAGRTSFFKFSASAAPIQDLAVASQSNIISILLGNGDGTFQSQATVPVGSSPASVAIGHFNPDAFEDLAVANKLSNTVSVLLGNGDGTFQSQATVPVGFLPLSVAIGRFNQDAFEDLAVANGGVSGIVSILLGNGDGTFFQPNPPVSVGLVPSSVAIGHFNGDAFEDLAVANTNSNTVSILLGKGDGTFQAPMTLPVGTSPLSVAIGHFNGDAFEDLAVANNIFGTISILLGNGDGTFQPQATLPAGIGPTSVAIGHFNPDPFADLAVSHSFSNSGVSILLGKGDGTFQPQMTVPVGLVPSSVAIGHFNNGDLFEDLVVGNKIFSNTVSILLGNGDGTFQPFLTVLTLPVGADPVFVGIGNFNNDSATPGFTPPPGDFSTLVKNADGTFTWKQKDGTRMEFDAQGLHTKTVDRNGNTTTYAYNPDGTLASITEPTGFASFFNYTGGKLSSITDSTGHTTVVTINASGDLLEIIDPDGAKMAFTYDSPDVSGTDHLMVTKTMPRAYDATEPLSPASFVTTYTYNFAGELTKTDKPAPGGQSITWNLLPSQANALVDPALGVGTSASNPAPLKLAQNVTATLTQPEGPVTNLTTDKFGAASKITDPLGRVTTIQRDNFGNPVKITKPNGAITNMTYDLKGNLLTMTEEGNNGPGSDDQLTTFTYEPTYNQVKTILDPNQNKNSLGVTTKIDYDAFGNPILITDAYDTITELKYDEPGQGHPVVKGLLTTSIAAKALPEQATTTFSYELALANLKTTTDPMSRITSFTYDPAGNTKTTKVEGNDNNPTTDQLTTFTYDPMNRLKTVLDAETGLTQYTYDKNGNLTKVVDAKPTPAITQFAYDEVDRLSKATDPVGKFETFAYDKDSKLKTLVDRKTQTFTLTYDAVFRLTQKEFPQAPGTSGNTLVTFSYDANQNGSLLDDNDNLAKVIRPEATLTNTYDGFDRLATVSTAGSPNQPDVLLTYTYDKNGNRLTLLAQQGAATVASLAYTLDKLNRVTAISHQLAAVSVQLAYDVLSRRKQLDFPNTTRTTTTYNAASDILTRTHTYVPTSTLLSSFTYTLDSVGNRATLTETRPTFTISAGLNTFGYDTLNRLKTAAHPTIPLESYLYDPVGNRDPSTWQYDVANRLTNDGTFTYTYDANGNQLTKTEIATPSNMTTYTYSPENWLSSTQQTALSTQYIYDGLDRRIQKDVNGTKTSYVYDHGDLLLEYTLNPSPFTLVARWLQGPGIDDPLLMERDTNSNGLFEATERFVYHADGLGSVTELTDSTGLTVRSYLYNAFGNLTNQTGTLANPYTYTSREYDPETGLLYYRARTLDPRIGRFLQEDPDAVADPDPDEDDDDHRNLYVYVENNPVNRVDPLGLYTSILGAPTPYAFPTPLPPIGPRVGQRIVRPPGIQTGTALTKGKGKGKGKGQGTAKPGQQQGKGHRGKKGPKGGPSWNKHTDSHSSRNSHKAKERLIKEGKWKFR